MARTGVHLLFALFFLLVLAHAPSASRGFYFNQSLMWPTWASTITTATYVEVLNLTFAPGTGCYLIVATAQGNSTTTDDVMIRLSFNSTSSWAIDPNIFNNGTAMWEPDVGTSGNAGPWESFATHFVTCITNTNNYEASLSFKSRAGARVGIRDAQITIMNLTNSANYLHFQNVTQKPVVGGQVYRNEIEKTFTVPTGGANYLIIGSSVQLISNVTYQPLQMNMLLDNIVIGNMSILPHDPLSFRTFMAFNVSVLAAGTHTVIIQAAANGTINNTYLTIVNLTGEGYGSIGNTTDAAQTALATITDTVNISYDIPTANVYTPGGAGTLRSWVIASRGVSQSSAARVTTNVLWQAGAIPAGQTTRLDNSTFDPNAITDQSMSFLQGNVTWSSGARNVHYGFSISSISGQSATAKLSHLALIWALPYSNCINVTSNYTMNNNVTASNTCFNITANNIVFDCNGYNITGAGVGAAILNSDFDNVTIKNCVINNFVDGISFNTTARNGTIFNNTITNVSRYGIMINDSSNYTFVNNNTIFLSSANPISACVYVNESHNVIISNLTANSSGLGAIYIYNSTDTVITNSSLKYRQYTGINLLNASNTNISFTTISATAVVIPGTSGDAIYVETSDTVNISHVTATALSSRGIMLNRSDFVYIYNSTGQGGSGYGLVVYLSNQTRTLLSTFAADNLMGTSVAGVYCYASHFLNITNSTLRSTQGGLTGFHADSCNTTRIENSTIRGVDSKGMVLNQSNYTTIKNCTIGGAISVGGYDTMSLTVLNSNNSLFYDLAVISPDTRTLNISGSTNLTFYSSSFTSSAVAGVLLNITGNSYDIFFVNTTFDRTKFQWGAGFQTNNITVSWYNRFYILGVYGSLTQPVATALVNATPNTPSPQSVFNQTTDGSGYTPIGTFIEFVANGTFTYNGGNQQNYTEYNPYTIGMSASGCYNSTSTATIALSGDVTVIMTCIGCGMTLTQNTTLDASLVNTLASVCFTIGADDISLDCARNGLNFGILNMNPAATIGVFNNGYKRTVIRNCSLLDFDTGFYFTSGSDNATFISNAIGPVSLGTADGIYMNDSGWATMLNTVIATVTDSGIELINSSNNQIINSTVLGVGANGIYLVNSSNNFIYNASLNTSIAIDAPVALNFYNSNNNIASNLSINFSSSCINITYSNATRIENSTCNLFRDYGINIYNSNYSFIYNSSITNGSFDTASGSNPAEGIYMTSSWFNLLQNLTIWNNSGSGIYMISSSNNSFENISVSRNAPVAANYPINLQSSNNNTFWNTTSQDQTNAADKSGVYMKLSHDNRFLNFTSRNNSYGMTIGQSDRNYLLNSTFINNSYGIFFSVSADNNYFVNSSIVSPGISSVYEVNGPSADTNNTFLNCTLGLWNVTFQVPGGTGTSYIRVQWYSRIQVLDYAGNGIDGADFNISNVSAMIATDLSTGTQAINITTGSGAGEGLSNWTIMEQGILMRIAAAPYRMFTEGNHTFNASKTGYVSNWTNVTINESIPTVVSLKASAVDVSFTVTLPGGGITTALNVTPPDSAIYTADIEFNASNRSAAWLNASVSPCCTNQQTDVVPIFQYTNTGGAPINISLWFNGTTMPAGVNVTASNTTVGGDLKKLMTGGGGIGCAYQSDVDSLDSEPGDDNGAVPRSCKNVTTASARSRFVTNIAVGAVRDLYLWAFYDNVPLTAVTVGGEHTRNITHGSEASSP